MECFFPITLEYFLNDLISKNPVSIHHSKSVWLQRTRAVVFEKIPVGEWEEHSFESEMKFSMPRIEIKLYKPLS